MCTTSSSQDSKDHAKKIHLQNTKTATQIENTIWIDYIPEYVNLRLSPSLAVSEQQIKFQMFKSELIQIHLYGQAQLCFVSV